MHENTTESCSHESKVGHKDGIHFFSAFADTSVSKRDMAKTSMRKKMKEWTMLRTTGCQIEEIANEINPVVRAWIGYYGKFYKAKLINFMREINLRIVKWARTKYLKVRPSIIKGLLWLKSIHQKQPDLFAHWKVGAQPTVE